MRCSGLSRRGLFATPEKLFIQPPKNKVPTDSVCANRRCHQHPDRQLAD
jgi:hypothetical protein